MEYKDSETWKSTGLNYLISNEEFQNTIWNGIYSKIPSGKWSEIIDTVKFIPVDLQNDMKDVKISD
jgi:hypothetical protein